MSIQNRNITALIVLIIAALSAPLIAALVGQTIQSENQSQRANPSPTEPPFKRNFPSVQFQTGETVDAERRAKSKKYNKFKVLNPQTTENGIITSSSYWIKSTEPLPLAESDVVVIGTVVSAVAHLSENKTSVYSEFKIEVEKVLKNDKGTELEEQKYLRAERDGGIVIFPTGFSTWYFVQGQRMPIVGECYVLFLTHNFPEYGPQTRDLYLLTGYNLKNGKVYPLDFADGGTHPTATYYNGKDESVLLSDLQNRRFRH